MSRLKFHAIPPEDGRPERPPAYKAPEPFNSRITNQEDRTWRCWK